MRRTMLAGLGFVGMLATSGQAQARLSDPQLAAGVGFIVAQPTGEFSNYVEVGGGFDGHVVWLPAQPGILGLRIDGSYLIYGSETRRYPLLPLIDVDVTTSNQIGGFQIGPQIQARHGAVKPYGFGQVGFSYFATTSSVEGSQSGNSPFAKTTNFDDFTLAGTLGGGILIHLAGGRNPLALDLGAHYVLNGRARYLREGSVTITGNTATFTPIESTTNMVVYRLGVTIEIGATRRLVRSP